MDKMSSAIRRYQNDAYFHNFVDAMVAGAITANMTEEDVKSALEVGMLLLLALLRGGDTERPAGWSQEAMDGLEAQGVQGDQEEHPGFAPGL